VGLGYLRHGKKKKEGLSKDPLGAKTRCEKKNKKTTLKKGLVFIQGAIVLFCFFL
jgi:hypothetical protein